jgi:glycerol-3-phosphate dehydrogenase
MDHDRDGIGGAITALGAKYTTARKVAEIATDLLASKLEGSWRACSTETTQLAGGEILDWDIFVEDKSRSYNNRVEPGLLNSLINHYGTEIDKVIRSPSSSSSVQEISQKNLLDILVRHAVENEMACSLSDVIFRRTGLGTIGKPDQTTIERIALYMGGLLGWNLDRTQMEIEEVEAAYRCLLP